MSDVMLVARVQQLEMENDAFRLENAMLREQRAMNDIDDLKAENARLQALVEEMQAALLEGMRRVAQHCADHEWGVDGLCERCGVEKP